MRADVALDRDSWSADTVPGPCQRTTTLPYRQCTVLHQPIRWHLPVDCAETAGIFPGHPHVDGDLRYAIPS